MVPIRGIMAISTTDTDTNTTDTVTSTTDTRGITAIISTMATSTIAISIKDTDTMGV
jgi:hypothetical protein